MEKKGEIMKNMGVWCWLVLCMFLSNTLALTTFEFETVQSSCAKLQLKEAIENKVAYNIAFSWNRFGKIEDWEFEGRVPQSDVMRGLECVKYKFSSQLKLPDVFQKYLSGLKYSVNIYKTVCSKLNVLICSQNGPVDTPPEPKA